MQIVIDALTARPFVSVGVGAFFSGVALFYLVMQRTRQHRMKQAENQNA